MKTLLILCVIAAFTYLIKRVVKLITTCDELPEIEEEEM